MLEKTESAYSVQPPRFVDIHTTPDRYGNPSMGITAENIAAKYGFSRTQLDEFSLQSHRRASVAWEAGHFDEQIVPVALKDKKGGVSWVSRDESVRPECSLDGLNALRPSFRPDGMVTAGNSSPMSDGAGALVLMEREQAEREGKEILAVFRGYASAGVDPNYMGLGPIPASTLYPSSEQ